jgi:predicted transcriptional regulator
MLMKTITKVWEDAVIAANVCKKKIVEVGMREELSVCEAPIMKIIWESNPDISVPELVKQLNEQYGKEYARTTVVTFLTRMAGKGYITTQRRGRISYVHAIKSEQEYKQQLAQKEIEFWFHGSMAEFAQTLCAAAPLTHEECQKLRRLLDHVEEK